VPLPIVLKIATIVAILRTQWRLQMKEVPVTLEEIYKWLKFYISIIPEQEKILISIDTSLFKEILTNFNRAINGVENELALLKQKNIDLEEDMLSMEDDLERAKERAIKAIRDI